LSKLIKCRPDEGRRWTPMELEEMNPRNAATCLADPNWIFETTGFVTGRQACSIQMSPEEIIARAKKRADEIARDAYSKGFEQGERAGFELGNKKAESVAQELSAVIQEIRNTRDEILRQSEREAVTLAMRLAEKIVCREISIHEDAVLDVAKDALRLVSENDRVRIVLNPEDLAFLEKSSEKLQESVKCASAFDLEADSSIQRGGCRVMTRLGEVNAEIDRKMEVLFQKVMERMESRARSEKSPETEGGPSC